MTDSIKLFVTKTNFDAPVPRYELTSSFVTMHEDTIRAIARAIAADPEAARGIVAAGVAHAVPTVLDESWRPQDAPTPANAGDEAAVEELLRHLHQAAPLRDCCKDILAAIKAGKVPGVVATAQARAAVESVGRLRAELAAEKERRERAEENATLMAAVGSTAQHRLDRATARVAELERQMHGLVPGHLLSAADKRIDALTAQRDRLAGLLRRLANTQDSTEEDYREADAALAALDKP